MKKIKINNKEINYRKVSWTEEITGTYKIEKGEWFFHSSREEIESFAPVETCFYIGRFAKYNYIYAIKINKDIEADEYHDEIRIDLGKIKNDCEIYLIAEDDWYIDGSVPAGADGRVKHKILYSKKIPKEIKKILNI